MLFEVSKYKKQDPPAAGDAGIVDDNDQLAPTSPRLMEVINLVDHGRTIHWMSEGDWSMHQLLQSLLQKTGPADVWISSFAFSELPARVICDLKDTGVIKQLKCIIDSRVDTRSASALAMLKNACNELKLCATHSKVTVLKNEEWFVAVVGSANYTSNKRIETGIITAIPVIASFHQKWIDNELRKTV